ncbi:hypothetical protein B0A49_10178 [Cryomyces minteri]|uniref:Uncharacterized protein n=1 Tax=Cryomyces minteri TaxID=331657 RepID=A0A4V5NHQ8_9PEZI|nr:hypothetical protein B0A49_10178 [Cryomyces minteri]
MPNTDEWLSLSYEALRTNLEVIGFPTRSVTDTVWVITGQDCEYWSGFAPNSDMWGSADVHDDAAVQQDYHARALSGRDVRRNEAPEGGSFRASTLIDLRRDGKKPDKTSRGTSRPNPQSDLVNQYIEEAPANDYALPKELMASITLEELATYFPNHCITWPGLALLLSQKGWTAASVSDHVSSSHGWTDLSSDERTRLRNTIGTKMNAAVRSILGPIQGAKWSISVARDTAWLQSNEKLNSLLWTAPIRLSLRAPCPLQSVGENIINHPQGQFAATVQAAMDAHAAGEDFQPETNRLRKGERAKRRRAGPAPPPGALADEIFHDYPSHMYLENMLAVQLKYSDTQIQHAISAAELPAGFSYDRAVPGHRRKHALRARAARNSTTYEEERRKFWNERREKADKGLISWKVRALRTENGLGRKQQSKEGRREKRLEKHLERALLED